MITTIANQIVKSLHRHQPCLQLVLRNLEFELCWIVWEVALSIKVIFGIIISFL